MNMKLETIPSHRVAYFRRVGPYGADNGQTMETLKRWAAEHCLLNDQSVILGIAHDDPATTKPEHCRYDACLIVADDFHTDDGSVYDGRIAGGKYAIFKVAHTAEAVQKAWLAIFPELGGQGLAFDETRPILERYAVSLVKNHFCEICVPIR